jgi:outer membrane protein OmpA-like peptidoglycan-associated protein
MTTRSRKWLHLSSTLFTFGLAFAAASLVPGTAHAQAAGFALDRFDPSERGSDWFANESLDLRGNGRPAMGLVLDWAYKPLVVYDANGNEVESVVSDQVFLHAGGNIVLADRFRIGVNLPIAVYQNGDVGADQGQAFTSPDSATIGDLRLGVDARLFGTYGDAITGAVGVQAFFPTGSRDQFTGDGTVRLLPRAMVSGDIDVFTYAAQLGFDYRNFDETFAGSGLGSEFLFRAAAGVKVKDTFTVGPEIYGSTNVTSDEGAFKTRNTPFEALLGGHFTIARDWRAGAGIGPGLSRGYGAAKVRVLASVEWAPAYCADEDGDHVCDDQDACPRVAGIPTNDPKTNGCPGDRDKDGIVDSEDACPDDPGPRTADPRTNGCPDRDHDGVADKEDACPDTPGVRTDDPKTNGCPPDRDHDGVMDAEDACPDVPGLRTNDPKTNGCPPDRDGDGVFDNEDACPDVQGVRTNDPKTNGCPPDRDGDKILDKDDACPDVPGDPDPDPAKNGCPKAIIQGKQIKISEQIKFRFGKAELDPASDPILEAVAKILTEHPEIKKIRIEGHTDNKGSDKINIPLSKNRAAAVRGWLEQHGIAKDRMTSDGFGSTKPIDTNDTDEGRKNNRRVEFHIVEDAEGKVDESQLNKPATKEAKPPAAKPAEKKP